MITLHKHIFQEAKTRPGVLFCECGKIKKLPCQHKFEKAETVYIGVTRGHDGKITSFDSKKILMQCKHCGKTDFIYV